MPQEVECVCCSEIPEIAAKIKLLLEDGYVEENLPKCITKHPGFDAVCINRWALEAAYLQYEQEYLRQISAVNK